MPLLRSETSRTPWYIAGILVVVTLAAVAYAASRRGTPQAPLMANAGNGAAMAPGAGTTSMGPAPDISNMSPLEQFNRLDSRITDAMQRGDTNTVVTFTPMALGAYANLPPTDRNTDVRFRTAMLAAQVGLFPQARALADTIMAQSPDNLLGYYLRATIGEFAGDSASARTARAAFQAHYDAEIRKARPEYTQHRSILDQFHAGGRGAP